MLARLGRWLRPTQAATADGPFTELDARRLGPLRRFFVRHPFVTDVVVALAYVLPAVFGALLTATTGYPAPAAWIGPTILGFALLGGLVLLRRRREPVLTVVALAMLFVACLALTGESAGYELALTYAMYAVAASRPPAVTWLVELGLLMVVATANVFLLRTATIDPDADLAGLIAASIALFTILTLIAIAIGVSVRGRRQHIDALIQRANALAHDREQRSALAVAEERTRIARELHDVVAHSLTVMVALADGARAAAPRDPEAAARALEALTETGRSALDDMRRVLGVLREPGDTAPLEPEPEPDLDDLVERFRTAGLSVRLVRSGSGELPIAVRRTVWRITQESLTNVLRYAPASPLVLVEVGTTAEGVEVRITNQAEPLARTPSPSTGTGRGIIGMRERVAALGGALEAGPHERGWQVHATLPVDEQPRDPEVTG